MTVQRTVVNPVTWSLGAGFNQGEVVSGHTRTLYIAGQAAIDSEGRPQHEGDMAGQVKLSVDNLEAVLEKAGMTLANLIRLTVYTTDVDLLFPHYGLLIARLEAAGVAPPSTLLVVSRLALPSMLIELEGTAVD